MLAKNIGISNNYYKMYILANEINQLGLKYVISYAQ